jgi:hypothetical protein
MQKPPHTPVRNDRKTCLKSADAGTTSPSMGAAPHPLSCVAQTSWWGVMPPTACIAAANQGIGGWQTCGAQAG